MAGEILTGGLNSSKLSDSYGFNGVGLNGTLDFANVSLIIGRPVFDITLLYGIGYSNKAFIRYYMKRFGDTSWYQIMYDTPIFDYTDGGNRYIKRDGTTDSILQEFAAYLLVVEPVENVVTNIKCTINVESNSEGFYLAERGKKLRISNNLSAEVRRASFGIGNFYPSYFTEAITTSVGTLLQNGQWIFGQN